MTTQGRLSEETHVNHLHNNSSKNLDQNDERDKDKERDEDSASPYRLKVQLFASPAEEKIQEQTQTLPLMSAPNLVI